MANLRQKCVWPGCAELRSIDPPTFYCEAHPCGPAKTAPEQVVASDTTTGMTGSTILIGTSQGWGQFYDTWSSADSDPGPGLVSLVKPWRDENARLKAEVERLTKENSDLKELESLAWKRLDQERAQNDDLRTRLAALATKQTDEPVPGQRFTDSAGRLWMIKTSTSDTGQGVVWADPQDPNSFTSAPPRNPLADSLRDVADRAAALRERVEGLDYTSAHRDVALTLARYKRRSWNGRVLRWTVGALVTGGAVGAWVCWPWLT